jgi:lipoprotein NlpD
VTNRLRLTILAAALALGACTQTVMVSPANQDTAPPASRPQSKSTAPTYVVQPGDTMYKISMQYGVDYRDLANWNGIAAPYTIYPKQTLRVGPETVAPAAVAAAPASTATVAPVQPAGEPAGTPAAAGGDQASATTAQAAKPEGYDPNLGVTLPAGAVPIDAPTAPSTTGSAAVFEPVAAATAASTAGSASAATGSAAAAATVESMPTATPPSADTIAPLATSPATSPPAAAATPPPSAGATSIVAAKPSAAGWIWPASGKVVVTYASGDPTRQGIDIAGEVGQDVRAARDGEVVYSGAGLIGYGELVIIKHSPELLSAYGHNRVRLVKEGDKVKSGQKIAEMGKNSANRVLLHFEVRKNGKPVDPLPLLPAR